MPSRFGGPGSLLHCKIAAIAVSRCLHAKGRILPSCLYCCTYRPRSSASMRVIEEITASLYLSSSVRIGMFCVSIESTSSPLTASRKPSSSSLPLPSFPLFVFLLLSCLKMPSCYCHSPVPAMMAASLPVVLRRKMARFSSSLGYLYFNSSTAQLKWHLSRQS